jgi:hypothetical protein
MIKAPNPNDFPPQGPFEKDKAKSLSEL